MDVGGWLRSLGLRQYEVAFRENEIDGEVLPNLTAEDLKELGVVTVGHRRRILAAIGGLSSLSAVPTTVTKPLAAPPPAERRQLTVMFCDLWARPPLVWIPRIQMWKNAVSAQNDFVQRRA